MKYTIVIDQVKSLEWDLNINQATLFSILYNISNWAKYYIIDANNGMVYHHASRNMVISEIPLCYSKPDTVYRAFMSLFEKGLIDYIKDGNKDLVRITEKGKEWNNTELGNKSDNSEINPNELGNKSENNSEINPTDQYTNIDQNTNDHILWKKDFEIYKKELREVYRSLINDPSYISEQEKFNPGLDIKLTLEKACTNYWATEAGWKKKKGSRIKTIDWKHTLTNSLSQSMNKVWKNRDSQSTTTKYQDLENYKPGYDR